MRQAFLLDMTRVVQILRLKNATGSVKKNHALLELPPERPESENGYTVYYVGASIH